MRWYRGKRAFITGGSSGIGKAMAHRLLEAGADVVIAARGEKRLQETVAELGAVSAGHIEGLPLDVADKQAVAEAVPAVLDKLGGRLDVLINNAGIAHPGYIQQIEDDVFEAMMRVNYFGTVNVTRAFLPHMIENGAGSILNVSSLLGFMGIFGYTAYAASKFAVVGFSDCLRQELLPHGIGISVLFPADTDTPQLAEENRIKPPETKAVAGNVKVMSPETVAKIALDGLAAGRYHILPGFGSKFTYFMYRHFPWMVRLVIDGDVKKYQRRNKS